MTKYRLLAALLLGLTVRAPAQNLLLNADFANGVLPPWELIAKLATEVEVEDGVLRIQMAETGNVVQRQLIQKNLAGIEPDVGYIFRFDALSEANNGEPIRVILASSQNTLLGLKADIVPSSDWATYECLFTTTEMDPQDPPALKLRLGLMAGSLYLRNMSLVKAE